MQQAAEHGDPATRADLDTHRTAARADIDSVRVEVRADLDTSRAEVRADLASLEARLIKWMIGIALTATGIVVAAGTAIVAAFPADPRLARPTGEGGTTRCGRRCGTS